MVRRGWVGLFEINSDHYLGSDFRDRCWLWMVYNICNLLSIRWVNLSDSGCFNMVYDFLGDNLSTWAVNLSDGWWCDMAHNLRLSLLLLIWLSNCRGCRVIYNLLRRGNHILGWSLLYRRVHRVHNNLLTSNLVLDRSFQYHWVLWMSHKFSGYNLVLRGSYHLLLNCSTTVDNWLSRLKSMEELVGL